MTDTFAILALGFFLGMRHATDPDHVIAITTIVSRHRRAGSAAWIGALWGLGHTLTILVVGGGIILGHWVIPPRVGLSMEFFVGVMLIGLGLMNLTGLWRLIAEYRGRKPSDHLSTHAHPHSHGDYIHDHAHGHDPERHPHDPDRTPVGWLDRHLVGVTLYGGVRPLVVGVVHGLAGSAAVALLVLATIAEPRWGVFYLLVFGLGTIAGMMVITAAIAVPFVYAGTRSTRIGAALRLSAGVISLAFGILIAYQVGVVHGLFTGQPTWTPR
ncbi:MAG: high-affinity nickel-transport family protein [Gemmatimonadales bacterium]